MYKNLEEERFEDEKAQKSQEKEGHASQAESLGQNLKMLVTKHCI
tara:strand:+ start:388 stop:522 length:135 start_codon:yes stop_codon:yes gene_type:complete